MDMEKKIHLFSITFESRLRWSTINLCYLLHENAPTYPFVTYFGRFFNLQTLTYM